jgi:hypothetical protein
MIVVAEQGGPNFRKYIKLEQNGKPHKIERRQAEECCKQWLVSLNTANGLDFYSGHHQLKKYSGVECRR